VPEAWMPHVTGQIRIREIPCRHQLMTEPPSLARIGRALAHRAWNNHSRKDSTKMTNPFEDETATYLVLHPTMRTSIHLWPSFIDVRARGAGPRCCHLARQPAGMSGLHQLKPGPICDRKAW